jgi:4-hydroxy-3-polyprenylbenzoate decarboxylase
LVSVTEAGTTMLPPVPAFYHHPRSTDGLINHTVGKVLDQFGIEHRAFQRWHGAEQEVKTDAT